MTSHRRIQGRLVIATHNPGKLTEMRDLLAPYGIDAVSAGELGLGEPEETGTTFQANARIKAEAARLQQAQTEVTNAQGQSEKEDALLKQAQAKARLATACSASAVDAMNRFFDATTARQGGRAAVAQLESTQKECQSASGGS